MPARKNIRGMLRIISGGVTLLLLGAAGVYGRSASTVKDRSGTPANASASTASLRTFVVAAARVDSLQSPAAAGSMAPSLSLGPGGRVYLTWFEPADSVQALRFASFDGTRWNAPRTIRKGADFFINWADFPALKMVSKDRLMVHWLQRSAGSSFAYGVRVAQSSDGGATWSAPITPHRDSAVAEHGFVTVWRDGDAAALTWLDGRNVTKTGHNAANEMMLMTSRVGPRGELHEETILDPRTCDCCQTAVATASSGPIIAYRDRSVDEVRDIHIVRRVAGKWSAPMPVARDGWHINACPVNGPAIAAQQHNVAVAWFTAPNDSAQVKVALSSNDGAWFGTPVRIDDGAPAGRVDAGILPDGGVLVTWVERGAGEAAVVRARRVSPSGVRGTAMTIASTSSSRASGFPRLVIGVDAAYFAWTVSGRPSSVRVARLALSELK